MAKAKPKCVTRATAASNAGAGSKSPSKAAKSKSGGQAKPAKKGASPRVADMQRDSRGDWRVEILSEVRRLIHEADPDIVEERKWIKPSNPAGVPVWSHAGIVCTGETYKQVVKLTFARGASLKGPLRLFNSSLEGNTRRAIDIREGERLDAPALKALIKAAVSANFEAAALKAKPRATQDAKPNSSPRATKPSKRRKSEKGVVLLSGGNPQIAKGDGDAPVQAYLAAMPGWKREVGVWLDALIARVVPEARRAIKWNSPFYGVEGQGWFLSFHVFTRYVKVTFFRGASLRPLPPGGTPRSNDARWIDIHEHDPRDETQLTGWIKQAASLPGWLA